MIVYIFLGIAIVLASLYVLSYYFKFTDMTRTLFKFLSGIGCIVLAGVSYYHGMGPVVVFVFLIIAIVLLTFGDFLLSYSKICVEKNIAYNFAGLICILLGHFSFVLMFSVMQTISYVLPIISISCSICIVFICRVFNIDFKGLRIILLLYIFVMIFLFSSSINTLIYTPITTSNIMFAIASGILIIGDAFLLFTTFNDKIPRGFNFAHMSILSAAQILFAVTLCLM